VQAQYAADKALLSERRDFDQQAESMRRQHEQSLTLLRQKAFREARQIEAHHEHAMAQLRRQCEQQLAATAEARRAEQWRADALRTELNEATLAVALTRTLTPSLTLALNLFLARTRALTQSLTLPRRRASCAGWRLPRRRRVPPPRRRHSARTLALTLTLT